MVSLRKIHAFRLLTVFGSYAGYSIRNATKCTNHIAALAT